jgi:hypothetical protein
MPTCRGTLGGASAIHSLTASSDVAPAHGAGGQGKHGGQSMPHNVWITRVGHLGQALQQSGDLPGRGLGCSRSWSGAGGIGDDSSAGTVFHWEHWVQETP